VKTTKAYTAILVNHTAKTEADRLVYAEGFDTLREAQAKARVYKTVIEYTRNVGFTGDIAKYGYTSMDRDRTYRIEVVRGVGVDVRSYL
jgi:hypothetical protein